MAATRASPQPAKTCAQDACGPPAHRPPGQPVQPGRITAGHKPASGGRVRNEVTPSGVWKLLVGEAARIDGGGPKRSHAVRRMETRCSLPHPGTESPVVRNKVTPSGVWKHIRVGRPDHIAVRNEVTPSGVWKPAAHPAYIPHGSDHPPRRCALLYYAAHGYKRCRARTIDQLPERHRPQGTPAPPALSGACPGW
jgi:hypothetical protein